jgi:arabinoxylan arabinofuranohydrolase
VLFDPGTFIDDDGQAYLYFGGNGDRNVRAVKLKRDMITLDGEVIKMSATNFFEAAWVYKLNGVYYFSYSTTPRAGMRFDYMTSDNPTTCRPM